MRRLFLVWLAVMALTGCAELQKIQKMVTPKVEPQPEVHSVTMAESVPVGLHVVDGRAQEGLGEYQDAFGRQVPVELGPFLTAMLGDTAGEALAKLGFVPVHDGVRLQRNLMVEVLRLDYQAAPGTVSGQLMVWAELRGVATNGDATYRVRYKMLTKKHGLFDADSKETLAAATETLMDVLNALLQDNQLVNVLQQ